MMTLEGAIKRLRQYQGYEPGDYGQIVKHNFDLSDETVDALLTALRPVSRERVEMVWRGEWVDKGIVLKFVICSKCGTNFEENFADYPFCPHCGAPMTDEAVEMVMERLEALRDE